MMSLSYDGDGALEWIRHEKGYDCPPAGELGYLPRCLCSPLVMDRMTQYMTEIKGPSWSLMFSKTLYASMFLVKDFAHSDWPPGLCGRFGGPR